MENMNNGMAHKEVWDKVSEDYTIEINETTTKINNKEEAAYADEIYNLLLKEQILPPAKLLELGCGSGHLSACLAKRDITYHCWILVKAP